MWHKCDNDVLNLDAVVTFHVGGSSPWRITAWTTGGHEVIVRNFSASEADAYAHVQELIGFSS